MTRIKKTIPQKEIRQLLVLSLCFILGQFIFSVHTSPLYPNLLGTDSAIFSLLGKGILAGKTLYLDLFDHKGPFIFFVNALGWAIGERTGLLIVQCVAGLISLFLLYRTVKMLRPEGMSWKAVAVIFFAGYANFFYTFEKGNLTEEYSIPIICCALFLFCKYALQAQKKPAHPPLYAFVYGVGIGALALFRLNNAVAVGAGVLVIMVYLICKKEYKNLFLNLGAGLAGLAVVMVPVLLYFWSQSALDEMIYATFLHNFQIFGNTSQAEVSAKPHILLILYAPMLVSGLMLVFHWRGTRRLELIDVMLGVITVLSFAALLIANRYPHYFAVYMPVYVVCMGRYLRSGAGKKICLWAITICTVLSLIGLGYYSYFKTVQSYFLWNETGKRYDVVTESFKIIPEDERDSVICYQTEVSTYHYADILPCYKYYALQEVWAITNPQILEDFQEWAATEKPLWIVTGIGSDNAVLDEILEQYYEVRCINDYMIFYRLK